MLTNGVATTYRKFQGESDYQLMVDIINGSKAVDGLKRTSLLEDTANQYEKPNLHEFEIWHCYPIRIRPLSSEKSNLTLSHNVINHIKIITNDLSLTATAPN